LTTVSEFDKWQAYFEERLTFHEKPDYYAAAMIRAIFVSQGAKAQKISDYMLEFSVPEKKIPEPDESDSRNVWLRALGVSQEQ
jgi:hypothetical protein